MTPPDDNKSAARRFADEAQGPKRSMPAEMIHFLSHNKKWWLAPIVIMLLLVGALVVLSSTVLAPFIYPLL